MTQPAATTHYDGAVCITTCVVTDEAVSGMSGYDVLTLANLVAYLVHELHVRGDVPILKDDRTPAQQPFWVPEDENCPAHLAF